MPLIKRLSFVRSIHMGRIVPEIDETIKNYISQGLNPKRLRTRQNMGFVSLPAQLELVASSIICKYGDVSFRKDVKNLINVLYNLKLPDDRNTIGMKKSDIRTELDLRDKVISPHGETTLHEEQVIADERLNSLILGILESRRRDWRYYEYDERASNLYLAARLAPNYACIKTVLKDISSADPTFSPKSVMDFGSGMGTTIWAVNNIWPEAVNEFLNIEISKEQQSLCERLLRIGDEFGDTPENVFHRKYLPSSNKTSYDLVVSAFSLLEIPNAEYRAQIIESLWSKTKDLLVIIERGNKGGFTVVNEARHLILDISGHDVTKKVNYSEEVQPMLKSRPPTAHILGPCSHEFVCPRSSMTNKKKRDICRFKVFFEPLEIGERKGSVKYEEFSYVILRKGPHPSYLGCPCQPRWPRIVEKSLKSGGQITHRICCPNGSLSEAVITKYRYGRELHELAKSCNWGDILPIRVKDNYVSRSSFIKDETSDNVVEDKNCDNK